MNSIPAKARSTQQRWLIFYSVGAMGIMVQMAVLLILTHFAHFGYLPATGLGVEAAVVHNFIWHERWTWADRIRDHRSFLRRLVGFHIANGALSLLGNLVLMRLLAGHFKLNYLYANAIAIALCSVLNYFAGDKIVFRDIRAFNSSKGDKQMTIGTRLLSLLVFAAILETGQAQTAELKPDTAKAWNIAVEKLEQRIAAELDSKRGFLSLDFQNAAAAAAQRQRLLAGEIPVEQISGSAETIHIPDGMIHHWRGTVFIPGATLDLVLSRVGDPSLEDTRQEDVLESRVLEKRPGQLRLYLKLQRSKIVTVVYNTEHLIRYRKYGAAQAASSSVATKIAEVGHAPNGMEQEKPEGLDHGYLWRMNSYWRYQETQGGVLVECESMTLSRSIPNLIEYMIRPIIKSVARESMRRTLESLRSRLVQAGRQRTEAPKINNPPVFLQLFLSNHVGRLSRAGNASTAGGGFTLDHGTFHLQVAVSHALALRLWRAGATKYQAKSMQHQSSSSPIAALAVTGSIRRNPTRAPIATAIRIVA